MRFFFISIAALSLLALSSCNDKTLQDLERANGKVAGKDWTFVEGNAIERTNEIQIILMKTETTNPCGVLNPPQPYVKFTVPARSGTYNIPFADASKSVKFYEGSSSAKNYTSTSGFVQVVSINGFTVDGLIQASFDDDNDIVGAFFVTSCN